jgi:hypothetical protein
MWLRIVPTVSVLVFMLACADSSDSDPQGGTGGTTSSGTGGTGLTATGIGTGTAGGTGGATGGSGGSGSGMGGGGGEACTPVTLGAFELSDTEVGGSSLTYALQGLAANQDHYLFLEFFDQAGPQTTGSFDLSQPPDDNYSTCSHCVLVFENFNDASPTAYFPVSGRIGVTEPDVSYTAESAGVLTGLRLVQVTIDQTVTTPVPGGACLALADSPWDTTP